MVLTKHEIVIIDKQYGGSVKIPLSGVEAKISTQSAITAMKILLFGIFALGAKEKLLVLDIDDPSSNEHYTSVFKDVPNGEKFADILNVLSYNLKTKENIKSTECIKYASSITNIESGCDVAENNHDYLIELTPKNFEKEVYGSVKPVLLYVYANWAAPCKMMEPVINKISVLHSEKLKIVKLNIDDHKEIIKELKIENVPTILVFNEGKIVNKIVGYHPIENIQRMLQF